jgi:AcrR family transcriptional regulator
MSIDLRERILNEAALRFVASGYHAVSMREIAEAVGASKAAIYYHFTDKEALLLAIMEHSLIQLQRIVAQATALPGSIEGQLVAIVDGLLGLDAVQRAAMRLAMVELQHVGETERRSFAQRYEKQFITPIRTLLSNGISAGTVRDLDVMTTTWAFLGLLYPFSMTAHRSRDGQSVSHALVDLFLRGIRADL